MMHQTCSTPIFRSFQDADRRAGRLADLGLVLDSEHADLVGVAERVLDLLAAPASP